MLHRSLESHKTMEIECIFYSRSPLAKKKTLYLLRLLPNNSDVQQKHRHLRFNTYRVKTQFCTFTSFSILFF